MICFYPYLEYQSICFVQDYYQTHIYVIAIFTGIGYNYVCQFSLTLSHQVSVVKLSDWNGELKAWLAEIVLCCTMDMMKLRFLDKIALAWPQLTYNHGHLKKCTM